MAEVFRIPLSNVPQRFGIDLNGKPFILIVKFNSEMQSWVLDILDSETEEALIACLPLVTGLDLLSQYKHVGIGGALIVYTDGNDLATPTIDNLGDNSNLYFIVNYE